MQIAIYGTYVPDANEYAMAIARRKGALYIGTNTLCSEVGYEGEYPHHSAMWQKINEGIVEISKKHKKLVINTPYAVKFCDDPYRIMLWKNPYVSAQQMIEQGVPTTVEAAVSAILDMVEEECAYAEANYNGYELTHPQRYDLILDVTYMSYEEAATHVVDGKSDIYLDKRNIIPTMEFDLKWLDKSSHIQLKTPVHMRDHKWYVSSGFSTYARHAKTTKYLIPCYYDAVSVTTDGTCDLSVWEKQLGFKINYTLRRKQAVINEAALQNVKATLFGNQKQANVINDSVVAIVAQYLDGASVNMDTQESTAEGIHSVLTSVAHNGMDKDGEMFVQLVAGRKSYDVLKEGLPYIITQNQPNVDSPKYNFRILVVGEEDPEDVVENGEKDVYTGVKFDRPAAAPEEVLNPEDTIAEQVQKLKDAILPMCPEAVKSEIQDEYAQALYCAQAYFEYNSR